MFMTESKGGGALAWVYKASEAYRDKERYVRRVSLKRGILGLDASMHVTTRLVSFLPLLRSEIESTQVNPRPG